MYFMVKKMIRQQRKSGFTLLEATIAMVLLAIAAAGILLPFANATSVHAEGAKQTMAANLASELMEKILVTNYADIISTYSAYSESEGALLDAAGAVHTGSAYSGFSRSVRCQSAAVGSIDLVVVTVTVYYDSDKIARITTLVGDHG